MPSKPKHRVITTDAEIDAAIAQSELEPVRRIVAAIYDAETDEVRLRFESGARLDIPRHLLQGLSDATPTRLRKIEIMGPGTGVYWPLLRIGHYVPGLLDGVFGTRKWMAELGKRGGTKRTPAKAAAARENGRKGGRPAKSGATAIRRKKPLPAKAA